MSTALRPPVHRPARVAYATCRGVEDVEAVPVLAAFARLGVAAEAAYWNDPGVDWAGYDLVLVRSVWDYILCRGEFLAWTRRVSALTRLANPARVLERNTDKTYLRGLAEAGLPVVPTLWVAPGGPADAAAAVEAVGAVDWPELVVKPTVSSGARDTVRTADRAAALAQVAALTGAGRTAMVQPYLAMVEDEGETSLLYLGGEFSHAVRRGPMLGGGFADVAREPDADQLALAARVLAASAEPGELLYARVDLVRLPDGSPALIELELTEPRLFLSLCPDGPERLAAAARALLPGNTRPRPGVSPV
ncbi:RimK family alpha-L-glutamate ligase [Kitasatospora phosalacinea]|uniref:RimK family alpha-L-glutamate ligase n=1 Tax=Kitasatospora phosalacinea TaxID=2065 RepID=A0ABW6GF56_9ACTN